MENIEFVGKALLVRAGKEKAIVIGDLHLGIEGSMRERGIFVPGQIYESIKEDLSKVFEKVGNVDKVIVLGDLKHEFGKILWKEREEVLDFLRTLKKRCKEIVIIKGNHDKVLEFLIKDRKVKVVDYFIWRSNAFLHGDRDFKEIHNREIQKWFVGHGHPAVRIGDGVKEEKYKCFLVGKFKGKEVFIVPSFLALNEGSDPRDYDMGLAWDFRISSFLVYAIEEEEVLDFGKLGKIS